MHVQSTVGAITESFSTVRLLEFYFCILHNLGNAAEVISYYILVIHAVVLELAALDNNRVKQKQNLTYSAQYTAILLRTPRLLTNAV